MFSHDPFQNYQTLGAYGAGLPYGLPYQGIQPNIHPLAFAGQPYPQQFLGGIGGYQQGPWQQQGLNPLTAGLHNPLVQNPLLNPLLAYQQMLAHQMWQQTPAQFPYPLAPQTLGGAGQGFGQTGFGQPGIGQPGIGQPGIGQPGFGQQYGQINPLAQMALRQLGLY